MSSLSGDASPSTTVAEAFQGRRHSGIPARRLRRNGPDGDVPLRMWRGQAASVAQAAANVAGLQVTVVYLRVNVTRLRSECDAAM